MGDDDTEKEDPTDSEKRDRPNVEFVEALGEESKDSEDLKNDEE